MSHLLVSVHDQKFAIPATWLQELVASSKQTIRKMAMLNNVSNYQGVIMVRGEPISLFSKVENAPIWVLFNNKKALGISDCKDFVELDQSCFKGENIAVYDEELYEVCHTMDQLFH